MLPQYLAVSDLTAVHARHACSNACTPALLHCVCVCVTASPLPSSQMPPDWLFQTIWHLERDKRLAFVQTRWAFTNGYDNLLCW